MSDAYEGRDKLKDVHTTPAATRLALKLVKQQLGPLCEVGGRGGGRRDCARGGGAAAGGDDAACTAAAARFGSLIVRAIALASGDGGPYWFPPRPPRP